MPKVETTVSMVKNLAELEEAYDIRRQVFMVEGDEPEEEQFDGNDFCATHLLAHWKGETVGTMRLRIVSGANGGTIIWERLAILKDVREKNPWVLRSLLKSARHYTELMGLNTIIGIVENPKLMRMYRHYGFSKTGETPLIFRGHAYTPMHMKLDKQTQDDAPTLRQAVLAQPEVFAESRAGL